MMITCNIQHYFCKQNFNKKKSFKGNGSATCLSFLLVACYLTKRTVMCPIFSIAFNCCNLSENQCLHTLIFFLYILFTIIISNTSYIRGKKNVEQKKKKVHGLLKDILKILLVWFVIGKYCIEMYILCKDIFI